MADSEQYAEFFLNNGRETMTNAEVADFITVANQACQREAEQKPHEGQGVIVLRLGASRIPFTGDDGAFIEQHFLQTFGADDETELDADGFVPDAEGDDDDGSDGMYRDLGLPRYDRRPGWRDIQEGNDGGGCSDA